MNIQFKDDTLLAKENDLLITQNKICKKHGLSVGMMNKFVALGVCIPHRIPDPITGKPGRIKYYYENETWKNITSFLNANKSMQQPAMGNANININKQKYKLKNRRKKNA